MREGLENATPRETLEQAEALFGSLADAPNIVWWALDLRQERVLYASPAFETLWEMTIDELYRRPLAWLDRIHPDDRPRVSAAFKGIPQSGAADEVFRMVLPSGKRRWIRDRGLLIRKGNQPSHIAGYAEDITAERNAQIRLAVQHMVVKILADAESPEDAFPELLEAMADPFDWAVVGLWLVEAERPVMRCAAFWRQPADVLRALEDAARTRELAPGEGLAGKAWETGEPAFESELAPESPYRRAALTLPGGLKSAAAFPITSGDKILGVLDFAGPDMGIPESEMVRTVHALARQVGLWIERWRAAEEARNETHKLRIVTQALSAFLATASWQKASDEMLKGALELTGSPLGFFGVVLDGKVMRILSWSGLVWDEVVNREFYDEVVRRSEREGYLDFPVGRNLFSAVITERATILANDPAHHPAAAGFPPGHPGLTAFLGVPIHGANGVIGVLGMGNRPGGYTNALRERLEALGVLAAVLCSHYCEHVVKRI